MIFNLNWLSNVTHVSKTPKVTWALLEVLALAYILQFFFLNSRPEIYQGLRLVPLTLANAAHSLDGQLWLGAGLSLVSHMFLHDTHNWLHLGGNMLALFALGRAVEARLGSGRFLLLYMATGIAGSLAYAMLNPLSRAPLIGASGAVFGVAAAYMVLWWKEGRVYTLVMLFNLIPLPLSLTAPVAVGLKVAVELAAAIFPQAGDQAAHSVHLASFLAGVPLALLYKYRVLGAELPLPAYTAVAVPDARDLLEPLWRRLQSLARRL